MKEGERAIRSSSRLVLVCNGGQRRREKRGALSTTVMMQCRPHQPTMQHCSSLPRVLPVVRCAADHRCVHTMAVASTLRVDLRCWSAA